MEELFILIASSFGRCNGKRGLINLTFRIRTDPRHLWHLDHKVIRSSTLFLFSLKPSITSLLFYHNAKMFLYYSDFHCITNWTPLLSMCNVQTPTCLCKKNYSDNISLVVCAVCICLIFRWFKATPAFLYSCRGFSMVPSFLMFLLTFNFYKTRVGRLKHLRTKAYSTLVMYSDLRVRGKPGQ